jgi:hypothetical protein
MQKHSTAKGRKGSTSEKRPTRAASPAASEPAEQSGPILPQLDWESYVKARAERYTARLGHASAAEREQFRAGTEAFIRRNLRHWLALGNFYADALTGDATPRAAQDAIWESNLDPLMDSVQINFSDPELLRVLYPVLRFLDLDAYSGGWSGNAHDEGEGDE